MKNKCRLLGAVLGVCLLALCGYAAAEEFMKYPLDPNGVIYSALLQDNKEALKGKIILDFGFERCAPCRELSAVLEEKGMVSYITAHGGQFYQWDVKDNWKDKNPTKETNLCHKFGVRSAPYLIFLKDGKEVKRLDGFSEKKTNEVINAIKVFMEPEKYK